MVFEITDKLCLTFFLLNIYDLHCFPYFYFAGRIVFDRRYNYYSLPGISDDELTVPCGPIKNSSDFSCMRRMSFHISYVAITRNSQLPSCLHILFHSHYCYSKIITALYNAQFAHHKNVLEIVFHSLEEDNGMSFSFPILGSSFTQALRSCCFWWPS